MIINDLAANSLAAPSALAALGSDPAAQSDKARSSSANPAGQSNQAAAKAVEPASPQASASTQVSLSAEGRLRASASASISRLQESSQALTERRNTDTPENARVAAQNFVNAYNDVQRTADGGANGSSTATQLAQTLRNNDNRLSDIGINSNADGTLSLDRQRFEQAAQSNPQDVGIGEALANVGQQVQGTTSQLNRNSSDSNAGSETANAAQQQAAQQQQDQLSAQQQVQEQPAIDQLNAINASGAAAYQKVFTL